MSTNAVVVLSVISVKKKIVKRQKQQKNISYLKLNWIKSRKSKRYTLTFSERFFKNVDLLFDV